MARHSSATPREETSTAHEERSPRQTESTPLSETPTLREEKSRNSDLSLKSHSIDASLKRRARLLITNSSIPRQTRSLIRYALEINDPHLDLVVHRIESGEMTIERLYLE
jgi:hypothetical protein